MLFATRFIRMKRSWRAFDRIASVDLNDRHHQRQITLRC
jgi:hypothetical protein